MKGGLPRVKESSLELVVRFGVMKMPQFRQWEWREEAREELDKELTGLGGSKRKNICLGLSVCKM